MYRNKRTTRQILRSTLKTYRNVCRGLYTEDKLFMRKEKIEDNILSMLVKQRLSEPYEPIEFNLD